MENYSVRKSGMVKLALLGAIIIILAATPFLGYIPLGFTRATIIHIPVIIGSIMLGPKKGAILGALFAITSLVNNTFNPTPTSFVFTPFYSIGDIHGNFYSLIICFVPRILVGVFPYFVYKFFNRVIKSTRYRDFISLGAAGIIGSLTNTLLVMNLIYLFFVDSYAAVKNISVNAVYGIILSVIAINGIPEMLVAGILTLAIGKAILKISKNG